MKKIFKIICFILLLTIFDVHALNTVNYEKIDNLYYTVRIGDYYHTDIQPIIRINDNVVYCLEPEKLVLENLEYNIGDITNTELTLEQLKQIELIGYYGYEFNNHNDYKYYLASQELIWNITRPNIELSWYKNNSEKILVEDEKREIKYWVDNHYKIPSLSKDTLNLTIDQDYLSFNYDGLRTYKVNNEGPHNVSFNYNRVSVKTSENFVGKVTYTAEKLKRNNSGYTTIYTLDGYQTLIYPQNNDNLSFTFDIVTKVGSITIEKVNDDAKNFPSSDATFDGTTFNLFYLSDNQKNYVSELITDESGKITIDNLKLGVYCIEESKVGEGYIRKLDTSCTNISFFSPSSTVYMESKIIKGTIEINKTYGDNYEYEKDAVFLIENKRGDEITLTTNDYGYSSIILPYGKYTIKQIKGIKNHELISPKEFIIDENNDIIVYNFHNEPIKFKLVLKNCDKTTGEVIKSPAQFKILDVKKHSFLIQNESDIFETSNGIIEIDNLSLGEYYISELDNPLGYIKPLESIDINPSYEDIENGVIEVPIYNDFILSKIQIIKNGETLNNNLPLNNVKIGIFAFDDIKINEKIYYKKDEIVEEIISNYGIAISKYLPVGKYYIKELETVKGYKKDEKPYYFEIKNKGVLTYESNSNLIKGKIIIEELTMDNELIDNVILGIYAKEDIIINDELYYKKDELIKKDKTINGQIIVDNLLLGSYYIKELETFDYFKLDDNIYEFDITDEEPIIKKIYKETIYSNILVTKIGIGDKEELLDDVLFGIYAKEDIIINGKLYYKKDALLEKVISKNGIAISAKLPFGKYYIKELETNKDYEIDNNIYYFDILNEEIKKINIYNYKKNLEVYDVPDTGIKATKANILFEFLIIFMGYIIVKYAKD